MGHNILIPHILDVFCQEIIKNIVFKIHFFAQQAITILYSSHDNVLNLWRNYLFINEGCLFTTKDLSNILKTISLKIIGFQLVLENTNTSKYKKAKLQARIKLTALCSAIDKENSIEFPLDFLHYLYNYYMVYALLFHAYHVT